MGEWTFFMVDRGGWGWVEVYFGWVELGGRFHGWVEVYFELVGVSRGE